MNDAPERDKSLWDKVCHTTQEALKKAALKPLATECSFIERDGLRFPVRILGNIKDKLAADQPKAGSPRVNPFLPYDPDLYVCDLGPKHVCLLNKFNVVNHHILMVTRDFEPQENVLNREDFFALALCLAAKEGVGFYNGGADAGASQQHKHLQMVPFPLAPGVGEMPCTPLLNAFSWPTDSLVSLGWVPAFGFQNLVARLDDKLFDKPKRAANLLADTYHRMMIDLDLAKGSVQKTAYNLLVTRRWMILIPRSKGEYQGIPMNGLGFGGALLVRNPQQLEILKKEGPLAVMGQVAVARPILS